MSMLFGDNYGPYFSDLVDVTVVHHHSFRVRILQTRIFNDHVDRHQPVPSGGTHFEDVFGNVIKGVFFLLKGGVRLERGRMKDNMPKGLCEVLRNSSRIG